MKEKRIEKEHFWHYGGTCQEYGLFWSEVSSPSEDPPHESMHLVDLRDAAALYGYDLFSLATKITHLRHWQKRTCFCGVCGASTVPLEEEEHARKCPRCASVFYPQIAPAVIVRIERDDTILLARNARFPGKMHSLIAGFVEPGESLEDTVRREIQEEVGLSVKNIAYLGSQPWPFPDSLMVGFSAQWEGGDIRVDNKEIIAADWFSPEDLPNLPRSGSIAYRMISQWISEKTPKEKREIREGD
jgi:NTP pyrophosphohydrolases containing a Zn-finger, probably nucleic-acid-binding